MAAPRIGIVTNFDLERQLYTCVPAYVTAVEAAGGLPILLPYLESPAGVSELLGMLDGVLLCGGSDLDPSHYGEPGHPAAENVVPRRDAFEMAVARAVLARDVPVLGICRGVQSLNVAAGGSLHPDIPSCLPGTLNHRDGTPLTDLVHPVRIEPGSRLAGMCGATLVQVNSWHHQAVRDVARGFRVSATAPDGVIEAIESDTHRFAVGVQWHPERIWEREPASRSLFAEFVAACARGGAARRR